MPEHSRKYEISLHRIQQILSLAEDVVFMLPWFPWYSPFGTSNRSGTRTPQYYSCYN